MIKIGFVGIGGCGGNIAEVAYYQNNQVAIVNTSIQDINAVSVINNKYLLGTDGGAGKDRRNAKNDMKTIDKANGKPEIVNVAEFIVDKIGKDIDFTYLIFSSGGGTGSGSGPMLLDTLRRLYPERNFGCIVVLPTLKEDLTSQANTISCLKELITINVPTIIIDNDKMSSTKNKFNKKVFFNSINNQIIENLNLFLSKTESASKYGNMDRRDVLKILNTPGLTVMSTLNLLNKNETGLDIGKRLIESLKNSIYVDLEYDNIVKRYGIIYELSDECYENLDTEQLTNEIGRPLEIFEGVYEPLNGEERISIIISGLSFPDGRLNKIYKILDDNKANFDKEKTYTSIDNDMSWFNTAQNKSSITKEEAPISNDSLTDLLSKY